jgi:hypothetical protein
LNRQENRDTAAETGPRSSVGYEESSKVTGNGGVFDHRTTGDTKSQGPTGDHRHPLTPETLDFVYAISQLSSKLTAKRRRQLLLLAKSMVED